MANQYDTPTPAMNNGVKKIENDVKDLRQNVASLKKDAVGLASNLKEAGVERAAVAADYVRDQVDTLKTSGAEQIEKLESRIKDKPLTYIGIALLAGAAFSFLFGRRS